ncbi:hypothetical protein EJB05_28459, partial [Eragrostis curvula]
VGVNAMTERRAAEINTSLSFSRGANSRMEGKTVAALCCLVIVLLSGQFPQVSSMRKFCRCYKPCYPECREKLPRWLCILKCLDDCSPNAYIDSATSAGNCEGICQSLSLCGMATGQDNVEACMDDCTKSHGAYAPTTANLN